MTITVDEPDYDIDDETMGKVRAWLRKELP